MLGTWMIMWMMIRMIRWMMQRVASLSSYYFITF